MDIFTDGDNEHSTDANSQFDMVWVLEGELAVSFDLGGGSLDVGYRGEVWGDAHRIVDPDQGQTCTSCTYDVTEGNVIEHGPFVRYVMAFGDEPAPPMAAMEEPAPIPRNFIVFFDWDRSDLTNEAKGVIASAASYAAQGGVSNIQLVGHADRSGDHAHRIVDPDQGQTCTSCTYDVTEGNVIST